MLTKLYLGFAVIAVAVMGTLTLISYNWLQSIGDPAAVVENYKYYAGISWTALWLLFVALVVFSNIVFWKSGRSWTLWVSLLFFVIFIIAQTFWLDRAFFDFQKAANLTEKNLFLKPFLGGTVSILGAIGIFLDQFIVSRLREKLNPKEEDEPAETEENE
ncbi:MAG: hypothetical protein KDB79_15270 [Acidobacteria bacterium]|nr:hypothetical protein [Acidobacteriota bacterium]